MDWAGTEVKADRRVHTRSWYQNVSTSGVQSQVVRTLYKILYTCSKQAVKSHAMLAIPLSRPCTVSYAKLIDITACFRHSSA